MPFSDAEWKVMDALWTGGPQRIRDLHRALEAETGWAYSTVKTLVARLVEKDALSVSSEGSARVYAAALERHEARGSALEGLVERAFGGSLGGLVAHLLGEGRLDARERAELRRLLDAEEREAAPRGGEEGEEPSASGARRRS